MAEYAARAIVAGILQADAENRRRTLAIFIEV